jgi:hypothetical protein
MTLDVASVKLGMPPAEVQKLADAAKNALLRVVTDELEQGNE